MDGSNNMITFWGKKFEATDGVNSENDRWLEEVQLEATDDISSQNDRWLEEGFQLEEWMMTWKIDGWRRGSK